MKKIIFVLLIGYSLLASCRNGDVEFPDYKFTTVYFANQYPVRTIVLGTSYVSDNTLDNAHQCIIYATMGGVYSNKQDRTLDVIVDNSLCNNLTLESATGDQVLPMPSNYYSLPSDMTVTIPSGSMMGEIKIQLTDAFFADPLAAKTTYVIPLKITKVANADSILSGVAASGSGRNRLIPTDWSTPPKDYILFAVKYKNPWDAIYLRRGIEKSPDTTVVYHQKYVEYDQIVSSVATKSMDEVLISLRGKAKGNLDLPFQLVLKFDNNGNSTLTNPAAVNYTVTGKGKYVKNGDMWGDKKRDVLYLDYQVKLGASTHVFADTLVMRDRAESFQLFTPYYNK
ncbi:DUF5627 domain-containing protein [Pedobacter panaciterrae]|jgi:hypothetical protein|uniref:DUF5627 domain-containing protein n=1 Tax=Pedobacter panaciterrae TaxID=363849 RepID=UPI002595FFB6|nr:DUF5627 domain-containing protein [uncultured Pedobacter sp.]